MSMLGQKLAAQQAAPPQTSSPRSGLAAARATCLRGEQVTLPVLGEVWIELAGEREVNEIESAVFAEMTALNLPLNTINARTYDSCRNRHTLARCVRETKNRDVPFGPVEEWAKVDLDLLTACAIVYNDVRERLDPVGMETLTREDLEGIRLAIEKKNPRSLRSYGVVALSLYMLATANQQSTSQIPASSNGE
jgi:hypothetical protein